MRAQVAMSNVVYPTAITALAAMPSVSTRLKIGAAMKPAMPTSVPNLNIVYARRGKNRSSRHMTKAVTPRAAMSASEV